MRYPHVLLFVGFLSSACGELYTEVEPPAWCLEDVALSPGKNVQVTLRDRAGNLLNEGYTVRIAPSDVVVETVDDGNYLYSPDEYYDFFSGYAFTADTWIIYVFAGHEIVATESHAISGETGACGFLTDYIRTTITINTPRSCELNQYTDYQEIDCKFPTTNDHREEGLAL